MYAERLTKEELMRDGINDITEDGRVIRNGYEITLKKNNSGYYYFNIYKYDDNGQKIKKPITRSFPYKTKNGIKASTCNTYVYKLRTIGLHRAMWAWHYGEAPEGLVVDHINNQHDTIEDYRLDNLQLLPQGDNIAKERSNWNIREIECQLNKPRSFYENKLANYLAKYEQAKADHDASACHKLRGNIANTKARLRYYDSHVDAETARLLEDEIINRKEKTEMTEQEKLQKQQDNRDLAILQYWKKVFRSQGNKKMWHECCKVEKLWKAGELDQNAKNHCIDVLNGLVGR